MKKAEQTGRTYPSAAQPSFHRRPGAFRPFLSEGSALSKENNVYGLYVEVYIATAHCQSRLFFWHDFHETLIHVFTIDFQIIVKAVAGPQGKITLGKAHIMLQLFPHCAKDPGVNLIRIK